MGTLLFFPGVDPHPPSRSELVDEASELILQAVINVFVGQQIEIKHLEIWHREIRDYFWRQEIKLEERRFREQDIQRWKSHWTDMAFRDINSRRPQ